MLLGLLLVTDSGQPVDKHGFPDLTASQKAVLSHVVTIYKLSQMYTNSAVVATTEAYELGTPAHKHGKHASYFLPCRVLSPSAFTTPESMVRLKLCGIDFGGRLAGGEALGLFWCICIFRFIKRICEFNKEEEAKLNVTTW